MSYLKLTYWCLFPHSFIIRTGDGKKQVYILRAVELAEGTLTKHTMMVAAASVRQVTVKIEILEPEF